MNENDFFHVDDPTAAVIGGMQLPAGWWSRHYEYPWALSYNNEVGAVVADMGRGYTYRPFTDALAERAGHVYSVDARPITWTQAEHPTPPNVQNIVADMTKQVADIPPEGVDRLFCISVIEDSGEKVAPMLREFARLISYGGLIVLTFDVQYDMDKPLGQYPGVNWKRFLEAVSAAGLGFRDEVHTDKQNALHHEEYNLACYHCILVKQ